MAPLWRQTDTIVAGARVDGTLKAEAYAICKSEKGAAEMAATITAAPAPCPLTSATQPIIPLRLFRIPVIALCLTILFFNFSQLIAVATRRADPLLEPPRRFFERRRLQVDLELSPPRDLADRIRKELRVQELTADEQATLVEATEILRRIAAR